MNRRSFLATLGVVAAAPAALLGLSKAAKAAPPALTPAAPEPGVSLEAFSTFIESTGTKHDNNRVQLFSGANMWGHEPVYMKIGLYRPDGGGSSTSIVVRNWSIKKV